jgi:hypothetical protein
MSKAAVKLIIPTCLFFSGFSARASITYAVIGTESAILESNADSTQTASYATFNGGSIPFSQTVPLSSPVLGDETADSSVSYFVGPLVDETLFSLSASASVPFNTGGGMLPLFFDAGALIDLGLGNGCNCGGSQPAIPVTQFTIDSPTAYTITASFTGDGNATSQVAAALSAGTTLGNNNVFAYSNLSGSDNQTNGYTYSGMLSPGTYTYGALYGLDNVNIADPDGSTGTGSIVLTLDATAVPEPSYGALLGLGCAAIAFARRRAKRRMGPAGPS